MTERGFNWGCAVIILLAILFDIFGIALIYLLAGFKGIVISAAVVVILMIVLGVVTYDK